MTSLPLIAPRPPRLSAMGDDLRRLEASGHFTNNGPELRAFEAEATAALFGGMGACLGVCNATIGLMIAIRDAARRADGFALMPALTFAATAQAAHWAGLTPLICDIDPVDWTMQAAEEERLLAAYGSRIAVIVPYATFGRAIDLDRYAWLSRRYDVGVVVDAAASLGTADADGRGFGAGAPFAIVYSMHATKTFAVAEGGLIHSGDTDRIARLRAMAGFGFEPDRGGARSATLPGLNAKLPEVIALMARAKLAGFDAVCTARDAVERGYRAAIGTRYDLQPAPAGRQAMQFMPVLLPGALAPRRADVEAYLAAHGIGVGRYFSPHIGHQPWIAANALVEPTPVGDAVAARMLSLPITDAMTAADAARAVAALDAACASVSRQRVPAAPRSARIAETLVIGGGPAGTAMLTAASKANRLTDLAQAGLIVVERDSALGRGRLGNYAITSDSTATTFLSAVKDNPHPEIAALIDHPAAHAVARYPDTQGVPLVEAGPLLHVTGERLGAIVRRDGGEVLTGHEAIGTRHAGGVWHTRIRDASGTTIERASRNVVIATGGYQPLDRLAGQIVAGEPLATLTEGRLLQSDSVLALGGMEMVADLLGGRRAPRVAVIGGSTSALATVALLLKARPALPFGAGGVTLLHRRALRPFYHSPAAAAAEGFDDYHADDICPVTGFVYRLAGFRLEARDLVLRTLGIDGRVPDPRLATHRIAGDDDADARRILAEADIVVAALGYRPHAFAVERADGTRQPLACDTGRPMVDPQCRVVDPAGTPIPGLYGIGLAAGFVPWGALGGEASFVGQANGLWLWQNNVGAMIVDQLPGTAMRAVA